MSAEDQNSDGGEKRGHSIKVPQLYKVASRILKEYDDCQGSLKALIYENRFPNKGVLQALLDKLVTNRELVKAAIDSSELLVEQPNFNPYLAEIFTAQLISKGTIQGGCKPILIFKEYEEKIKAASSEGFLTNQSDSINKATGPRYIRVNTLVTDIHTVQYQLDKNGFILDLYDRNRLTYEGFLKKIGNLKDPHYMLDYHIPDLLVFPRRTSLLRNLSLWKHTLIPQDKASCLPVYLSSVSWNDKVIDACASPGNKTSQIAARMNNMGEITAVERDEKRYNTLKKLLENRSVTCVSTVNEDFSKLDPSEYSEVEYIFVDPTCSASGAEFHKDELAEDRIWKFVKLQKCLLSHALGFPSVKEVVYSTCSLYAEENEMVVGNILDRFGEKFELADLSPYLDGWMHLGLGEFSFGYKCLRTVMNKDLCTGFFVAKFVRKSEEDHMAENQTDYHKRKLDDSVTVPNTSSDADATDEPQKVKAKKKKINKNSEENQSDPHEDDSITVADTISDAEANNELNKVKAKKKKKKTKKNIVESENMADC